MFYAALFAVLVLIVGIVYFSSNRKMLRAPGLRGAMAIIALLLVIFLIWLYRSRYGG